MRDEEEESVLVGKCGLRFRRVSTFKRKNTSAWNQHFSALCQPTRSKGWCIFYNIVTSKLKKDGVKLFHFIWTVEGF